TVAVPVSDSQYQIESPAIPVAIDFWFPYEAHKNDIYSFIPRVLDSNAAPRTLQIAFAGAPYVYFQDPIDPGLFYYLPDSFKLCRRQSSPHYPCLSLVVDGETLETAQVTLSYAALPVVDQARLDAAASAPEATSWAGGAVRFKALPAQKPVFCLRLPETIRAGLTWFVPRHTSM